MASAVLIAVLTRSDNTLWSGMCANKRGCRRPGLPRGGRSPCHQSLVERPIRHYADSAQMVADSSQLEQCTSSCELDRRIYQKPYKIRWIAGSSPRASGTVYA